jgi:hypothetical protein
MSSDELIRIKTLLSAGQPIPNDIATWLISGINAFESGDCKTLCRALNLRRPGLSSPKTRQMLNARNKLLKEIASMCQCIDWRKAYEIHKKLHNPYLISEFEKPFFKTLFILSGSDYEKYKLSTEHIYKIISK